MKPTERDVGGGGTSTSLLLTDRHTAWVSRSVTTFTLPRRSFHKRNNFTCAARKWFRNRQCTCSCHRSEIQPKFFHVRLVGCLSGRVCKAEPPRFESWLWAVCPMSSTNQKINCSVGKTTQEHRKPGSNVGQVISPMSFLSLSHAVSYQPTVSTIKRGPQKTHYMHSTIKLRVTRHISYNLSDQNSFPHIQYIETK